MDKFHSPVLLRESVEYLITDRDGAYFDGTFGFGGHSKRFLERLDSNAILIGTDLDQIVFKQSLEEFSTDSRVRLYNFNFTKIGIAARLEQVESFCGIFADLGVSSYQLDASEEGFSYRVTAPLDLRMNKSEGKPASHLINNAEPEELAKIFREYGEEIQSGFLAKLIVKQRQIKPFKTTTDLAKLLETVTPQRFLFKRLSRVFQALRIEVNGELDSLREFLKESMTLLKPGGRIVILTYHSLEDRIVKEFFKEEEKGCICPPNFPVCVCNKKPSLKILTKKPVSPSAAELEANNRARSGKLRAAEKI
ncbi:16S rRNA (cytosine(1402)-N(4))-methyltransferase RsmH [Ignavibacteriales bacterium]